MKFLRFSFSILQLAMTVSASLGQSSASVESEYSVPNEISVTFENATLFTDRVASAVVSFPELVESAESNWSSRAEISIYGIDIQKTKDGCVAQIRWMPRKVGILAFPAFDFQSETTHYRTGMRQLRVSEPMRSEEMAFELKPAKLTLYAGEPLRVDVSWKSSLSTKRLRSLHCYPAFFDEAQLEVVVPRSTAPENEQMGLPFGGRRVIAHRNLVVDSPAQLGSVSFSLYLRFSEPGTFTIPASYLECAYLREDGGSFAPYASYFNNALFDPVNEGLLYDRLFVESAPVQVEVLPLPDEGRSELFSGVFAPCEIIIASDDVEYEVGQIMDLELIARSPSPFGMIDLPDLRKQRSLRSLFKVDEELGRAWRADGTRFRMRARALTTRVKAFPSLQIQIFDPDEGQYRMLNTEPIPMTILARDGVDYFDVKSLNRDESTLIRQPNGVWENDRKSFMSDVLNTISGFLAEYSWIFFLAGPAVFFVLMPRVREARYREHHEAYGRRVDAYRAYCRLPEGSEERWLAFRDFLAISFGVEPKAWTVSDARKHLQLLGADASDLEAIVRSHEERDAGLFKADGKQKEFPDMKSVAKRISTLLGKTAFLFSLGVFVFLDNGYGSEWERAETLFSEAIKSSPQSQKFMPPALSFEAAARLGSSPGEAWYNAGNAWFEAGELGQSIACYRQSQIYKPFDKRLVENLAAARALTVDVVPSDAGNLWPIWPLRWLLALLSIASLVFWGLLLAYMRYRTRWLRFLAFTFGVTTLALVALALRSNRFGGSEGVIIVTEVYGLKGPSRHYETAFYEPLHDGLEFRLSERRSGWLSIMLSDGRLCWIPESAARLIVNPR